MTLFSWFIVKKQKNDNNKTEQHLINDSHVDNGNMWPEASVRKNKQYSISKKINDGNKDCTTAGTKTNLGKQNKDSTLVEKNA